MYIYIYIRTYIHTYVHTYIHTYIHLDDMGMQGFEGGSSGGQLRYVYKCCELKLKTPTAAPSLPPTTATPSEEPTIKPTGTYTHNITL